MANKKTVKKAAKKTASKKPRHVIFRGTGAGVHFGEFVKEENGAIVLRNSIRLWRWDSKFTLTELAVLGVRNRNNCKFSIQNPDLVRLYGVCELINVSHDAAVSIVGSAGFKP